ncbi:putative folylpolyglutamate synthase [Trichinella spiralis]|uniref:tetrahydrofolate synthase n=1 Tax=Trichinella spiralis TaxID=6334 RepID=E5S5J0_TRISP|nr:putative folylpolyglutamate synthase [Trichinella spiralis]KRY30022.1 Folylpolyglutamate synthase, mitochondrial [Trichinella spiralis]
MFTCKMRMCLPNRTDQALGEWDSTRNGSFGSSSLILRANSRTSCESFEYEHFIYLILLSRIQLLQIFNAERANNSHQTSTLSNTSIDIIPYQSQKSVLVSIRKTLMLLRNVMSMAQRTYSNAPSFKEVVKLLNELQITSERKYENNKHPTEWFENFAKCIPATGLEISKLDQLNVIHVSGTKGKGSVCAFVESILRSKGIRTGFFSSPHLVSVRERIRINNNPISEECFRDSFWTLYRKVALCKNENMEFKTVLRYFPFLTTLAFHIFFELKVDVAILEVGIGGTYDCTNIVKNPVVCAITRLDFDHTQLLGDTIEEIAWNKAGIMKKGIPTFTVPQCTEAMEVFEKRSKEIGCPLYAVNDFSNYQYMTNLGIAGEHQKENANLAIHLARYWIMKMGYCCSPILNMNNVKNFKAELFDAPLNEKEIMALESCRWPGRSQIIKKNGIEYYLDGAHTPLSIQCCAAWFGEAAATEADYQTISYQSDTRNNSEVIRRNMQIWKEIQKQDSALTNVESFCCISTAHDSIRQLFKSENMMITDNHQRTIQVLVTGSLTGTGIAEPGTRPRKCTPELEDEKNSLSTSSAVIFVLIKFFRCSKFNVLNLDAVRWTENELKSLYNFGSTSGGGELYGNFPITQSCMSCRADLDRSGRPLADMKPRR